MDLAYMFSAAVLGCFFGAQLCEAILFVPFWKTMSPLDFRGFYLKFGAGIHKFFSPLTILAFLIPSGTAIMGLYFVGDELFVHLGLVLSCLLFFSTYFLFFKKANQKFSSVLMDKEELLKALDKWALWHWGRVVFEFIAFCLALYLIK